MTQAAHAHAHALAPGPGHEPAPGRPREPSHVWRLDELEIDRKLLVREVWYWMDERLHLYALRGNAYEPVERSEVLPGLDHELLLRHVDSLSVTKAVRAFRAALRGQ